MVASPSAAPATRPSGPAARRGKKDARGARPRPRARPPDAQHPVGTGIPLLATKLTPPRQPIRLVSRPRLFARVDAGAKQLLTLVSAPAGAGKTTLLATWACSGNPPGPVAWLSLDEGDNEPTRFWAYMLAALCRSGAVPAGGLLRSLAPPQGGDEDFLPLLVSALAELPAPVMLVLDDLQDITDSAVLNGLAFLLHRAPPQLRLMLATRLDPPLPMQRLLVSGQLAEVRAADLAFTVAEVGDLLDGYEYRQRLSDDDLVMLQARTEGWAAGLRLAALSLQGQPDPHRFVAELAGDDKSIADYLVGEVLERQPEELRSFLLRTCVVEELNGKLADALTGGRDGEWTLARLERANAFVMEIGSRRGTYRYHSLFATLLRYELRRKAPDRLVELHQRAARWYAARGEAASAIRQTLEAGSWRDAADLMAEHGLGLILRGDAATLQDLLGRLPGDLVQEDPELALLGAAERILSDDPGTAIARLRLADQREALPEDRRGRYALLLAVLSAAQAWQTGDLDRALAAGHEALALQEPAGAVGAGDDERAVTLANLGAAELWAGELDAAEVHLREGQAVARRAGLGSLQLACTSQLAVLHAVRGALDPAFRLGRDALKLAEQRGWSSSTRVAGGYLALAWVHYHRDELVEASHHLERAAAVTGTHRQPSMLAVAILRAKLQHAWGDLTGSLATVASARQGLTGSRPPAHLWRWLVLTEAELRSAAGQAQPASALLEGLRESGPLRAWEATVVARLQLAEGDPAGAATTVAPCLDGTAPGGFLVAPAEAWLLDSLARDTLGDRERAAASLERALTLAEQGGFRRSFLDAGAPARSMLARYRQRVPASWSYLDELLQASTELARATTASPPAMIDPLTERERIVLRYLPSLMTYEEIASDLYVSLNTVKSHAHGIFRKLGVTGHGSSPRRRTARSPPPRSTTGATRSAGRCVRAAASPPPTRPGSRRS
jgi:LuxR family maltose regulon positive regulatory protein